MSVGVPQSALRRKLGKGRAPVVAPAMTLGRAWRLALVHGLSEAAGLVLTMDDIQTGTVDPPDMPGLMQRGDLAILMEGNHGCGVALLDVQLMAALIEAQTMGRVLVRPARPRVPTATDGALVADPLDRVLTLFEAQAEDLEDAETCFGMRYATPLVDGRAVMLALPDDTHRLNEITLSLGDTERKGRLRLILPVKVPVEDAVPGIDEDWQKGIERNLMGAHAELTAVLTRLHLPIERVSDFQVGDMLTIPSISLSEVALTSCTGTIVAQGRLGQANGQKAMLLDKLSEYTPVPLLAATPRTKPRTGGAGELMTGKAPFGRR